MSAFIFNNEQLSKYKISHFSLYIFSDHVCELSWVCFHKLLVLHLKHPHAVLYIGGFEWLYFKRKRLFQEKFALVCNFMAVSLIRIKIHNPISWRSCKRNGQVKYWFLLIQCYVFVLCVKVLYQGNKLVRFRPKEIIWSGIQEIIQSVVRK